ncbi:MAG: hypothetical protein KKE23_04700 [Nanoarchaeota archaeon]|nr:hypothetical protein [Nanoarchaeota archaeon]
MISDKEIRKTIEKHREIFETLENYDKTRELPFQRKRIDVTLSVRTINKLRQLKEKTGKPISRIIEECFN